MANLANIIRNEKVTDNKYDDLSLEEHLEGLESASLQLEKIANELATVDEVEGIVTQLKGINKNVAHHIASLEADVSIIEFDFDNCPIESFTSNPSKTNLNLVNSSLEDWKTAGVAALVVALIGIIAKVGAWIKKKFFSKDKKENVLTKDNNPTSKAKELADKISKINIPDKLELEKVTKVTNKLKTVNGLVGSIVLEIKAQSGKDVADLVMERTNAIFELMGEKEIIKNIETIVGNIEKVEKDGNDANIKELEESVEKYKNSDFVEKRNKFIKGLLSLAGNKNDDITAKLNSMFETIKKQTEDDIKPLAAKDLMTLHGKEVKGGKDLKDLFSRIEKGLKSFANHSNSNNIYNDSVVKSYNNSLEKLEKRLNVFTKPNKSTSPKGSQAINRAFNFISNHINTLNKIIIGSTQVPTNVHNGFVKLEEITADLEKTISEKKED